MNSEVQQTPEKVGRFRALIIGRPNAGKTTILRRIAQSADGGNNPSKERGIHNVKDELVFSSNPGFVFHEAGGIEAGSTTEMENIQAFISERANAMSLEEKLHAIWYCIPTDNSRLVTVAEEQFFDNLDPDGVPVVLIFTKFESGEIDAFEKLLVTHSLENAVLEAPYQAREDFDQKHLHRFINRKYAPKAIAYLKEMHKENASCADIIEQTMKALNNDTLKWLLASVQKVDPKLRIKEMLKRNSFRETLHQYASNDLEGIKLANFIWTWYPHVGHNDLNDEDASLAISPLVSKTFPWSSSMPYAFGIKDNNLHALCFVASLVITSEHSFCLPDGKIQGRLNQAAKFYIKSSVAKTVSQKIQADFRDISSEILNILREASDEERYESQIALPLCDIICNNLLRASTPIFP